MGTKEFVQEFIDHKITRVEVLLEKMENPQVIGALIKQCVQGPKLAHLMRTTNPEDTKDQWKRYDAVSQGILEYMVGAPIKPKEWEMATMRKDESGLGLVNFPHTAPICFVASISASRPLQTHLLKKSPNHTNANIPRPFRGRGQNCVPTRKCRYHDRNY